MSWWLVAVAVGPLGFAFGFALVKFVMRVDEVEPAPLEGGEPREAVRAAIERNRR